MSSIISKNKKTYKTVLLLVCIAALFVGSMYPAFAMEYPKSTSKLILLKDNHTPFNYFFPRFFAKQLVGAREYYYVGYRIGWKSAGLLKFDLEGNIIWDLNFSNIIPNVKNCYKISVVNQSDFSYLYALLTIKNTTDNINTYLIKVDTNGNVVWIKLLNSIFHQELFGIDVALGLEKTLLVATQGVGKNNRILTVSRFSLTGEYLSNTSFMSSFETMNWVLLGVIREKSDNDINLILSFSGYKKKPPNDISIYDKWRYLSWRTYHYELNNTNLVNSYNILNGTFVNAYFLNEDTVFLTQRTYAILYNLKTHSRQLIIFPVFTVYHTTYMLSNVSIAAAPTTDGHIKILYYSCPPIRKSEYIAYIIDYNAHVLNYSEYTFAPKNPLEQYGLNWEHLLLVEPDNVVSAVGCVGEFLDQPGSNDSEISYLAFLKMTSSKDSKRVIFYPVALLFTVVSAITIFSESLTRVQQRERTKLEKFVLLLNLNVFLVVAFIALPELTKLVLWHINMLEYFVFASVIDSYSSPMMIILIATAFTVAVLLNLVFSLKLTNDIHLQSIIIKLVLILSLLAFTVPLLFTVTWPFGITILLIVSVYGALQIPQLLGKKVKIRVSINPAVFMFLFISLFVITSYESKNILSLSQYVNSPEQIAKVSIIYSIYPELYFYEGYSLLISVVAFIVLLILFLDGKSRILILKNIVPEEMENNSKKGSQDSFISWFYSTVALCLIAYLLAVLLLHPHHILIFNSLALVFLYIIGIAFSYYYACLN